MIEVFLVGNLGKKFGKKWQFDADTPMDVFKALDANNDGFIKYLAEKERENIKYRIWVDKKPVSSKELDIEINSKKKMLVMPVMAGSGLTLAQEMMAYGGAGLITGWGLSWLGNNLFEGTVWGNMLGFVGDVLFEVGAALLIQGVISSLMDEPENPTPQQEDSLKSSSSFIFSNPTNNVIQGARVPVGYGRLRIGSHVVSSSVLNCRMVNYEQVSFETNTDSDAGSKGPKEVATTVVGAERVIS